MHIPSESSGLGGDTYRYGKKYAFWAFFILTTLMLFDFIDRMVIASLATDLKRHFFLSDKQFGMLLSIVHVALSVLAFPASVLIDRWSRKNMVGLMALAWGVASLLCAFAPTFGVLLVLRFIVGAGEAGYAPGATTILEDAFPKRTHNTVLGLFQAAGPVGLLLGTVLGGFIVQRWGWQHAFGIVAIPGILIAILAFFLKEPARVAMVKKDASGKEVKVSFMAGLVKIMKTPTLLFIYGGMAACLLYSSAFLFWLPTFFVRTFGMTPLAASKSAALPIFLSAVGTFLGGFVADRFARKNAANPLRCAAVYMVLCCVTFVLLFNFVPAKFFYPVLLFGSLFVASVAAPAMSSVMYACHKSMKATAIGIMIVVQNLLGMSMGTFFSGALSDMFGKKFLAGTMGVLPDLTAKFQALKFTDVNRFKALYTHLDAVATQTTNFTLGQFTDLVEHVRSIPLTMQGFGLDLCAFGNSVANVFIGSSQAFGLRMALSVMCFTPILAALFFFMASRYFKNDCANAECFE